MFSAIKYRNELEFLIFINSFLIFCTRFMNLEHDNKIITKSHFLIVIYLTRQEVSELGWWLGRYSLTRSPTRYDTPVSQTRWARQEDRSVGDWGDKWLSTRPRDLQMIIIGPLSNSDCPAGVVNLNQLQSKDHVTFFLRRYQK